MHFNQLVDALRKCTTRYREIIPSSEKGFKRENSYQTNDRNYQYRDCVYSEKSVRKASDSKAVSDIEGRRLMLFKRNYAD